MDDHLPIFFIWTVLVCVLLSNNCTQKTFMFLIFFQFFSYFGGVIFLATVAIPWVLIALVVFVIIFLIVRWLFLTTARELKRLEALCEYTQTSPILCLSLLSVLLCFPQLAVPSFHTCPPHFKVCRSSALTPCSLWPWNSSTTTRIETRRRGTSILLQSGTTVKSTHA